MDPLLPLGLLSGCLGAYSGVKTEKIKRECDPNGNCSYKPIIPAQQPVQLRFFSNLVRDVSENWKRLSVGSSRNLKSNSSYSDETFTHLTSNELPADDVKTEGVSSLAASQPDNSKEPSTGFKLQLPNNFQPLKSKFYGDSFQMHRSSVVKNAFLSPALAEDELLMNLPHVDVVVSNLCFLDSEKCLLC